MATRAKLCNWTGLTNGANDFVPSASPVQSAGRGHAAVKPAFLGASSLQFSKNTAAANPPHAQGGHAQPSLRSVAPSPVLSAVGRGAGCAPGIGASLAQQPANASSCGTVFSGQSAEEQPAAATQDLQSMQADGDDSWFRALPVRGYSEVESWLSSSGAKSLAEVQSSSFSCSSRAFPAAPTAPSCERWLAAALCELESLDVTPLQQVTTRGASAKGMGNAESSVTKLSEEARLYPPQLAVSPTESAPPGPVPSQLQIVTMSQLAQSNQLAHLEERYACTGRCGISWVAREDVPCWSKSRPSKPWCTECGADALGPCTLPLTGPHVPQAVPGQSQLQIVPMGFRSPHEMSRGGTGEDVYACTGNCGRSWVAYDDVPYWSKNKPRKPWCMDCGSEVPGPWNQWNGRGSPHL